MWWHTLTFIYLSGCSPTVTLAEPQLEKCLQELMKLTTCWRSLVNVFSLSLATLKLCHLDATIYRLHNKKQTNTIKQQYLWKLTLSQ